MCDNPIDNSKKIQLGEMISIIAHQWKQPLAAIGSSIAKYEIKRDLNKDITQDEIDMIFKDIAEQVEFASNTVDNFRYFFNPNQQVVSVDLNGTIKVALTLLNSLIIKESIQIVEEINLDTKINTFQSDLIQVLINLLKNAIEQFKTQENKIIKIVGYESDGYSIIEIIDNAGGIKSDIIQKIFDKYFSTKDSSEGTGLGLYLCKNIIEDKCKGTISVDNIFNGAKFKLKLKSI